MALILADRVKVRSRTTGLSDFTLENTVDGFQSFEAIGDGNTTYYGITDVAGNWEIGIGTYTSFGTTLTRDTIISSSNNGSKINFPVGSKNVFCTFPSSALQTISTGGFGSFEFVGSTISTVDSSSISVTQPITLESNAFVGGDILPKTDNSVDLGSPTQRFRHLYVAEGTIYIGNVKLENIGGKLIAKTVINPGEDDEQDDPDDSDAASDFRGNGSGGNILSNGDWEATLTDRGVLRVDNTDTEQNYFKLTSIQNENDTYGVMIDVDNQAGWTFLDNGNIQFPDGTIQTTAYTGEGTVSLDPYKGFKVQYGRMYADEPTISKLVIYQDTSTEVTSEIDTSTDNDFFRVSGLANSGIIALINVYGSDSVDPVALATLKTFAEAVIDNVILDQGVEGNFNSADTMRQAFYDNYSNFGNLAGSKFVDFKFSKQLWTNLQGTTRQGSGAMFDVIANDGDPGVYSVTVTNGGSDYIVGHKIKILGSALGGVDGVNDLILTVVQVDPTLALTVSGTADGGALTVYTNVTGTNYQVGSGAIFALYRNEVDGVPQWDGYSQQGSNYVVGDVIVVPGTSVDGTSPTNDITVTINGVDLGGLINGSVTLSGTLPTDANPDNNIYDGGADQYDTANYIFTNLQGDSREARQNGAPVQDEDWALPYNVDTVSDGEAFFGTGSEYTVVYNDSIFGLFVTGTEINWIGTNGNSGFDGDGDADTGSLYNVAPLNLGDITFNGVDIQGNGDGNGNFGAINLVPNPTLKSAGQYVSIYPTTNYDAPHIHIAAGSINGTTGDLFLGTDDQYVQVKNDGTVSIQTVYNSGEGFIYKTWQFNTDGWLSVPTNKGLLGLIDTDIYVRARDYDDDGFGVYQQVTDNTNTVLGETELRRGQFQINFPQSGKNFDFNDDGRLNIPGNILGPYGSSSSYSIPGGDGNSTISLKIIDNTDTVQTALTVKNSEIKLATSAGAYNFTFDNTGKTTLPGAVVKGTVEKVGIADDVGTATALSDATYPSPIVDGNYGPFTLGVVTFTVVVTSGVAAYTVTATSGNSTLNDGLGFLDAGDLGGTPGNTSAISVASIQQDRTPLDLAKSINKLTNNFDENNYYLADGVEGQIMYLVPTPNTTSPENIKVYVNHGRAGGSQFINGILYPFTYYVGSEQVNTGMCTLIFTDDHWQQTGGSWD
jgi:hypothetical protein